MKSADKVALHLMGRFKLMGKSQNRGIIKFRIIQTNENRAQRSIRSDLAGELIELDPL